MGTNPDRADRVLAHYGIPGMKWGRRKAPGGGYETTGRAANSSDHTETRELKKQATRTLSNQQIKKVNERLQLESNLNRLKLETNPITRGEKITKTTLGIVTTAGSLYALSKSPAAKAVADLLKEKLKSG